MSAAELSREEVAAFLSSRSGPLADLEPLSGGGWSSAWAYRAGGEELVARFGPDASWYEADRLAMAFSGPDLPVPEACSSPCFRVPAAPDVPVLWHQEAAPAVSWREFLLDGPDGGREP
jgi:hypothetical protein